MSMDENIRKRVHQVRRKAKKYARRRARILRARHTKKLNPTKRRTSAQKQAVRKLMARGYYKKIARLREALQLPPVQLGEIAHPKKFVDAILEWSEESDTPREFAAEFLAKDPAFTATDTGLCALQFEHWMIEKADGLYGKFVETEVDPSEEDFIVIFEGKLSEEDWRKIEEDTSSFVELEIMIEAGAMDPVDNEVSDYTILSATPVGEQTDPRDDEKKKQDQDQTGYEPEQIKGFNEEKVDYGPKGQLRYQDPTGTVYEQRTPEGKWFAQGRVEEAQQGTEARLEGPGQTWTIEAKGNRVLIEIGATELEPKRTYEIEATVEEVRDELEKFRATNPDDERAVIEWLDGIGEAGDTAIQGLTTEANGAAPCNESIVSERGTGESKMEGRVAPSPFRLKVAQVNGKLLASRNMDEAAFFLLKKETEKDAWTVIGTKGLDKVRAQAEMQKLADADDEMLFAAVSAKDAKAAAAAAAKGDVVDLFAEAVGFNHAALKRHAEHDAILAGHLKGKENDAKHGEAVFNSEVRGDSAMEREYRKHHAAVKKTTTEAMEPAHKKAMQAMIDAGGSVSGSSFSHAQFAKHHGPGHEAALKKLHASGHAKHDDTNRSSRSTPANEGTVSTNVGGFRAGILGKNVKGVAADFKAKKAKLAGRNESEEDSTTEADEPQHSLFTHHHKSGTVQHVFTGSKAEAKKRAAAHEKIHPMSQTTHVAAVGSDQHRVLSKRAGHKVAEALHPAIVKYNAARQSDAEAKLKTPEGEKERQRRNAERLKRTRTNEASGDEQTFEDWMARVTDAFAKATGEHDEVPDCDYDGWFDRGFTVKNAVARMVKAAKLMSEGAEKLNVGDPVKITGKVELKGRTGTIKSFGQDNRFVVVKIGTTGKTASFHSSDVSYYEAEDDEVDEAKLPYDAWMKAVSAEVDKRTGMSADDLPDCPYADWHDDGVSPKNAAARAIKAANSDESIDEAPPAKSWYTPAGGIDVAPTDPKLLAAQQWSRFKKTGALDAKFLAKSYAKKAGVRLPEDSDEFSEHWELATLEEGVADTIWQQLGSARMMLGAKNAGAQKDKDGNEGVVFKIGRNAKGINVIRIYLMPTDTYRMEFCRMRNHEIKVIASVDDVYAEGMKPQIEKHTGMYTSFGKIAPADEANDIESITTEGEDVSPEEFRKRIQTGARHNLKLMRANAHAEKDPAKKKAAHAKVNDLAKKYGTHESEVVIDEAKKPHAVIHKAEVHNNVMNSPGSNLYVTLHHEASGAGRAAALKLAKAEASKRGFHPDRYNHGFPERIKDAKGNEIHKTTANFNKHHEKRDANGKHVKEGTNESAALADADIADEDSVVTLTQNLYAAKAQHKTLKGKGDEKDAADAMMDRIAALRKRIKTLGEALSSDEDIEEASPPGFSGTVKAMKKHKGISNPFALAWAMYKKGAKPHHAPEKGKPRYKSPQESHAHENAFMDLLGQEWREYFDDVTKNIDVAEMLDLGEPTTDEAFNAALDEAKKKKKKKHHHKVGDKVRVKSGANKGLVGTIHSIRNGFVHVSSGGTLHVCHHDEIEPDGDADDAPAAAPPAPATESTTTVHAEHPTKKAAHEDGMARRKKGQAVFVMSAEHAEKHLGIKAKPKHHIVYSFKEAQADFPMDLFGDEIDEASPEKRKKIGSKVKVANGDHYGKTGTIKAFHGGTTSILLKNGTVIKVPSEDIDLVGVMPESVDEAIQPNEFEKSVKTTTDPKRLKAMHRFATHMSTSPNATPKGAHHYWKLAQKIHAHAKQLGHDLNAKPDAKKKAAESVDETETKNEGGGFHGTLRVQGHSQEHAKAIYAAAHRHLVTKHKVDPTVARNVLDSTHGRHMADHLHPHKGDHEAAAKAAGSAVDAHAGKRMHKIVKKITADTKAGHFDEVDDGTITAAMSMFEIDLAEKITTRTADKELNFELDDVQTYYDIQVLKGVDPDEALEKVQDRFELKNLTVNPMGVVDSTDFPDKEDDAVRHAAAAADAAMAAVDDEPKPEEKPAAAPDAGAGKATVHVHVGGPGAKAAKAAVKPPAKPAAPKPGAKAKDESTTTEAISVAKLKAAPSELTVTQAQWDQAKKTLVANDAEDFMRSFIKLGKYVGGKWVISAPTIQDKQLLHHAGLLDLSEDALDEGKLNDADLRKYFVSGKSIVIDNVWWTIKNRDLDKDTCDIVVSEYAIKDGHKPGKRSIKYSSILTNINSGKWGGSTPSKGHVGHKQDKGVRAKLRAKHGKRAAPGTATESVLPAWLMPLIEDEENHVDAAELSTRKGTDGNIPVERLAEHFSVELGAAGIAIAAADRCVKSKAPGAFAAAVGVMRRQLARAG